MSSTEPRTEQRQNRVLRLLVDTAVSWDQSDKYAAALLRCLVKYDGLPQEAAQRIMSQPKETQ